MAEFGRKESSPERVPAKDEETEVAPIEPAADRGDIHDSETVRVSGNLTGAQVDSVASEAMFAPPPVFSTVKPLGLGSVLKDRFVLTDVLGQGGMGTVYRALDRRAQEALDRNPYIAIKVLKPELSRDPQFLIAMQRETKRCKTLAHPNVIQVYDFDRDGPHVFMSMEYLPGEPLSAVISKLAQHGMPLKKAWPLIEEMGHALSYAHRKRIIHCDFKPGNVFVCEGGEVKVLDFGIARLLGKKERADGDMTVFDSGVLGALSPPYASLELLLDLEPDPRDDVYALACVVYELLSGKHPFARMTALHVQELNIKPKRIAQLNRRQWAALEQGLALHREDRTESIESFINELSLTRTLPVWLWGVVGALLTLAALVGIKTWQDLRVLRESPKTESVRPAVETQQRAPAEGETAAEVKPRNAGASPDGALRIQTAEPEYWIGESLRLRFSVSRSLYLRIVYISASGETVVLLPSEKIPDRPFLPGTEHVFPPKDADFDLAVEGPPGVDRIIAVGSEKKLPASLEIIDDKGELTEAARNFMLSVARISYTVR